MFSRKTLESVVSLLLYVGGVLVLVLTRGVDGYIYAVIVPLVLGVFHIFERANSLESERIADDAMDVADDATDVARAAVEVARAAVEQTERIMFNKGLDKYKDDLEAEIKNSFAQLGELQRSLEKTRWRKARARMNNATQYKLTELVRIRKEKIKDSGVTIGWTTACELAGIRPETASKHAPTLRARWDDAKYRPEFPE